MPAVFTPCLPVYWSTRAFCSSLFVQSIISAPNLSSWHLWSSMCCFQPSRLCRSPDTLHVSRKLLPLDLIMLTYFGTVAAITIAIYDWVILFDDEVQYIASARMSVGKLLYYFVRWNRFEPSCLAHINTLGRPEWLLYWAYCWQSTVRFFLQLIFHTLLVLADLSPLRSELSNKVGGPFDKISIKLIAIVVSNSMAMRIIPTRQT